MEEESHKYLLALQRTHGLGTRTIKTLIAYCGGPKAIFDKPSKALNNIPGIGRKTINAVKEKKDFSTEEQELQQMRNKGIQILNYYDSDYPAKLKELHDAPLLLYYKGQPIWQKDRIISIVGTRKPTAYGKKMCRQLIEGLAYYEPVIVSGLAYGIDITAHKAALDNGLATSGIMAHGMDQIYPHQHKNTAGKMLNDGALITEYPLGTKPEREYFPERNRIIAGLSDAVIVIESGPKGGATITADIAFSYNRDVFAVPGNADVEQARGCNRLVKNFKAAMVETAGDVAYQMGWDLLKSQKAKTVALPELSKNEEEVVTLLKEARQLDGDTISTKLGRSPSEVASLLLNLEFKGVVKSLPGNQFTIN